MKKSPVIKSFSRGPESPVDLARRTLRTTAILVGSVVVFVGGLSTAAVLVASKAVAPSGASADEKTVLPSAADTSATSPSAPKRAAPPAAPAAVGHQSI